MSKYRISIDTGGTFTDVVVSQEDRPFTLGKALTTHDRVFVGIRNAISVAAGHLGISLDELFADTELLIYGTTRATNAIVEGKTAKTAFLVTEGFPDILVYREGGKTGPHDFTRDYPDPYIPRSQTFEVPERVNSEGGVETALDELRTRHMLEQLAEAKFEAVAVCLLWSIVNPEHELRIGQLIEEILPGTPYTLSHQLLPILREYRRASATAIDASLKPLMQRHLQQMEADFRDAAYAGPVLVSTSMGGCLEVEELVARPINTTKSGPAMAPIAALAYAALEGSESDVIVCDTGGTTFDIGLIRDDEVVYTRETWIGEQWRGHIVATSSVAIKSIGAGGGSIAWVDPGGLLRVGPQSAGSEPGPACYGQGGQHPTVTDAALLLGYLDAENFLGGRMQLDRKAAEKVIGSLAGQVSLSVEQTASAIIEIASELMVKAIGEVCLAEGISPGDSALVAGGGAAGLNILKIGAELGSPSLIVPKTAGALSACGMQFSDIVGEQSRSFVTTSDAFDADGVKAVLSEMSKSLERFSKGIRFGGVDNVQTYFSVEARYLAQVWELSMNLPRGSSSEHLDLEALVEAFHSTHERILGIRDLEGVVEFLNWKAKAVARIGRTPEAHSAEGRSSPLSPSATRPAYFDGRHVNVEVFDGSDMIAGDVVTGPAIIQEPTTTIVVYPGQRLSLTAGSNYVVKYGV